MFLGLNGTTIRAGEDELVALVMGVAGGTRSKAEVAVFLSARVSA